MTEIKCGKLYDQRDWDHHLPEFKKHDKFLVSWMRTCANILDFTNSPIVDYLKFEQ